MAAAAGSRVSGLLGQFQLRLAQPMSSGAHGKESSADMWKALTYLVMLPGVGESMLHPSLSLTTESTRDPSPSPTSVSASGPSPFPEEMVTMPYSIMLV